MHQKSRYNLRLAQKKGVTVRWSTNDEDFSAFMKLQHETATRQQIRLHPDHYYRLMFETLRSHNMVELGIAEYQGEIVAVNEIIWCGSTATYIHGASSDLHKEAMAPYFLQWETLQRARQKNMRAYDLRGISPADQPDHKLAGVTRFKLGLGGKTVIYPEAMNAILQPTWYWAYRLAKRARGGQGD
jgi:lipid II:glycine glycyltransferase (peptidoglycan interpeptide bridge formation enzyme)